MKAIPNINTNLSIDGNTEKEAWVHAARFRIDEYPWYEKGTKQGTDVRLLYGPDALYMLFESEDAHSSARVTELNGPVCTDSCVELFASPDPEAGPHYFNIEINCCGTMLMGYGPDRHDRISISPDLASRVSINHSLPGPVKESADDDCGWVIEAALPWSVLKEFAGIAVPQPGMVWNMNFYRIGGAVDPQFACWAPISTDKPDFHQPSFFKPVMFA